MDRIRAYIMFTDIKNYSKLAEDQLGLFLKTVWKDTAEIFNKVKSDLHVLDTWGDALFVVFQSPSVVDAILKYRDYFRNQDFQVLGLPQLSVRIGCHFGELYSYHDPLRDKADVLGININTAARIEPVTRPNDIFVTQEFVEAFNNDPHSRKPNNVEFDRLGEIPLAKKFGKHDIYLLRRDVEESNVIDRLITQDLTSALPDVISITEVQKTQIRHYKSLSPQELAVELSSLAIEPQKADTEFFAQVAQVCKSKGLYSQAIEIAGHLETYSMPVDNMLVFPYRNQLDLQKTKANALTRKGDYQQAAEIMYSLWKGGAQDSETLSMLAAQYKRRALYDDQNQLRSQPERALLDRSFKLYLEAFRREIYSADAYYPAINAAYLGVMLGGDMRGTGRRLADYIRRVWKRDANKNWWISSTIAEAYLLNDEFSQCAHQFKKALTTFQPQTFEVDATQQQIEVYVHLMQPSVTRDDVQEVMQLFEEYRS